MHLDEQALYRAVAGRDPRYDGRVYVAVRTTGIYCRPSCPARTPRPENCHYYASAAAAVAAGFRACRRCRPDALPGSREWDHRDDLAARALRLIRDGVVDDTGVAGLAGRLHVSERHLHRTLTAVVGAGPLALARTRRAQTARLLIDQTDLTLADVAYAAGFASLRQFNDVMRTEFGMPPSRLRRRTGQDGREPADPGVAVPLRLRLRRPYDDTAMWAFLAGHRVAGLEEPVGPDGIVRVVTVPSGHAAVTLRPPAGAEHVPVAVRVRDVADLPSLIAAVRRWLDLDADPLQVDGALGQDPVLAPLLAARPGLRVPGSVDGYELAVRAILGQHVSVAAGQVFAARLVACFGAVAVVESHPGLTAFPSADTLAAAGPERIATIGVTTARAVAVAALAEAVAGGAVDLGPGADRMATRHALLGLPGIGTWTADYVAMRGLGDPDVFPAGDLVLRRELGVGTRAQARRRAEAWRPWRSYAALHVWTARTDPPARPTQTAQSTQEGRPA